jgi:hypothetical protein
VNYRRLGAPGNPGDDRVAGSCELFVDGTSHRANPSEGVLRRSAQTCTVGMEGREGVG